MRNIPEIQVKWHPKTLKNISQIPTDGMEYAFVSEDNKQVHQLVWCKDFMQDVIFGFVNNEPVDIFGFEYDPSRDVPISRSKTRIMVCNWRDKDFEQKLLNNCAEFIHGIETQLKMRYTQFSKCTNPPPIYRKSGVFVVEGSKRWMVAPPMMSFYTLMLRIGMVHPMGQPFQKTLDQIYDGDIEPYNFKPDIKSEKYGDVHEDNDCDQLRNGWIAVEKILRHGDRNLFHKSIKNNYYKEAGIYFIHDDCGLMGFSVEETEKYFPTWHSLP